MRIAACWRLLSLERGSMLPASTTVQTAQQSGREYGYVLMGPDAAAVTDATMRELELNREAAVRAGSLKGFESRYVTSYDGTRILKYSSA